MKKLNTASLRDMVEQLPTRQLDEMLREELKKESVDDNAVRLILGVLEEREKDFPVEMTPSVKKAWEKYRAYRAEEEADRKPRRKFPVWLRVASVILVLGLLQFVLPQQAAAENFFDMLARWTDCIFEFFSPGADEKGQLAYEFRTDNPGLQQVYDAATELGITAPVVPMWLPEGYELTECKKDDLHATKGISACFSDGQKEVIYRIDIRDEDTVHEYQKDATAVELVELYGTTFYIIRNNERWVVTWINNDLECGLTIDCQKDVLYEILRSIYTLEVE